MEKAHFIEVGAGDEARRIAALTDPGAPPTLIWLGGFKSEMTATKATALSAWARANGHAMVRFDYSGHGASEGDFEAGTVTRWLEEAGAAIERFASGPLVLIGSSMGGWIALRLVRQLIAAGSRLAGIVLIAPAVDMTERLVLAELTADERAQLERDGRIVRSSQYGPDPYVFTQALIADGRRHLFGRERIAIPCAVRVLHGLCDPDVPWQMSLDLARQIDAPSVHLTLIGKGDHRLSRREDIALLISVTGALALGGEMMY